MNKIQQTESIISSIAAKSDRAILFYSCGKDSIVLLDLIAPYFKEIVCVFMYFVKDLEHINRYIRYSKAKYNNIRFMQVPHWTLTHTIRGGLFCAPNPNIKLLSLKDIEYSVRLQTGIEWSFYGMKQADSMNRRLMLKTYEQEAISHTGKAYPLTHWTNKEVLSYMKNAHLPQSIRYSNKASGGVGFSLECFLYLRDNYPQDLQKILNQFPFAEKILYEYDQSQSISE